MNGLVAIRLKIPSIIVTLGTLTTVRRLAFTIVGGVMVSGLPDAYKIFGRSCIDFVPIPVVIMIAVFAAVISGVNVERTKTLVFALCRLIAGI